MNKLRNTANRESQFQKLYFSKGSRTPQRNPRESPYGHVSRMHKKQCVLIHKHQRIILRLSERSDQTFAFDNKPVL